MSKSDALLKEYHQLYTEKPLNLERINQVKEDLHDALADEAKIIAETKISQGRLRQLQDEVIKLIGEYPLQSQRILDLIRDVRAEADKVEREGGESGKSIAQLAKEGADRIEAQVRLLLTEETKEAPVRDAIAKVRQLQKDLLQLFKDKPRDSPRILTMIAQLHVELDKMMQGNEEERATARSSKLMADQIETIVREDEKDEFLKGVVARSFQLQNDISKLTDEKPFNGQRALELNNSIRMEAEQLARSDRPEDQSIAKSLRESVNVTEKKIRTIMGGIRGLIALEAENKEKGEIISRLEAEKEPVERLKNTVSQSREALLTRLEKLTVPQLEAVLNDWDAFPDFARWSVSQSEVKHMRKEKQYAGRLELFMTSPEELYHIINDWKMRSSYWTAEGIDLTDVETLLKMKEELTRPEILETLKDASWDFLKYMTDLWRKDPVWEGKGIVRADFEKLVSDKVLEGREYLRKRDLTTLQELLRDWSDDNYLALRYGVQRADVEQAIREKTQKPETKLETPRRSPKSAFKEAIKPPAGQVAIPPIEMLRGLNTEDIRIILDDMEGHAPFIEMLGVTRGDLENVLNEKVKELPITLLYSSSTEDLENMLAKPSQFLTMLDGLGLTFSDVERVLSEKQVKDEALTNILKNVSYAELLNMLHRRHQQEPYGTEENVASGLTPTSRFLRKLIRRRERDQGIEAASEAARVTGLKNLGQYSMEKLRELVENWDKTGAPVDAWQASLGEVKAILDDKEDLARSQLEQKASERVSAEKVPKGLALLRLYDTGQIRDLIKQWKPDSFMHTYYGITRADLDEALRRSIRDAEEKQKVLPPVSEDAQRFLNSLSLEQLRKERITWRPTGEMYQKYGITPAQLNAAVQERKKVESRRPAPLAVDGYASSPFWRRHSPRHSPRHRHHHASYFTPASPRTAYTVPMSPYLSPQASQAVPHTVYPLPYERVPVFGTETGIYAPYSHPIQRI